VPLATALSKNLPAETQLRVVVPIEEEEEILYNLTVYVLKVE
jgi:hypothetical protein